MNWDFLKPILAQALRDVLRTAGTILMSHGFIQNGAGVEAFVGAGMTLGGLVWGWWTTSGYMQASELIRKMTTPPAAGIRIDAIAKILLVTFVCSAFLPGAPAMAQAKLNLPIDPLHLNGTKTTGNASADMQALWQKIVASSLADLNYAAAMAKQANTATSQVRLQCLNAIITLNEQASGASLKNADGTPMAKPDPHLFTDVESLAEVVDNLSPQGPLFVGCSGAAQLAKTNVLSFVNAVVTGAAGFAAMPVIPGL